MTSVNDREVNTFTELFYKAVDPDGFISAYILGHLMVEFLLVKIITIHSPELSKFAKELNHSKLIHLVHGLGLLSDDQKLALLAVNRMRNRLAHEITYTPTVSDFRNLFVLAARGFSDFTDGLEQGLGELESKESLAECDNFICSELFMQISYDLHHIYQELGGDIEKFR